jgi:hypothetical protein
MLARSIVLVRLFFLRLLGSPLVFQYETGRCGGHTRCTAKMGRAKARDGARSKFVIGKCLGF